MFPLQPRFAAVLAATILVGCSTTDTPRSENASRREYQTGSNVPRKDRSGDKVQTYGPDSVQQPLPPITRPPANSGGG
jgi:hypothetical protein